jgi:hypothetical protein
MDFLSNPQTPEMKGKCFYFKGFSLLLSGGWRQLEWG